MEHNRFSVIGAGAWGTALAVIINRSGADVTLWSRNEAMVDGITKQRINERYLPDIFIDPAIHITSDLTEAAQSDVLLLAIPAQSIRTMCITLSDMIDTEKPLIIASKGIERGSLSLMSEVLEATLPSNPTIFLSGPNFASEAARGMPTAVVLASQHQDIVEQLQFMISGRLFRPYVTDDITSVQIGGAVKNVIALACGMTMGAKLGENARAAIMTRGLAEITRLAEVKGGRADTLTGLAGLGDLMLSCSSTSSRNMAFGHTIGQAQFTDDITEFTPAQLTEGVMTAEAVYDLSLNLGVRMPICVAVANILQGRCTLEQGIEELLNRPLGME